MRRRRFENDADHTGGDSAAILEPLGSQPEGFGAQIGIGPVVGDELQDLRPEKWVVRLAGLGRPTEFVGARAYTLRTKRS